ncbi:MAG: 50S ribosomal protein L3 N(5)-glutamine methyltransferase [Halioglobus sp.]
MSFKPDDQLGDTLESALHYSADRLSASGVFFGHGTDSAWDEAVHLVLAVAGLDATASDTVLSMPFSESHWESLQHLLARRIEERVPLPYLLGKAWFAGLEFICDERAIIPRSPIAELILNDFAPWYTGEPPRRLLDLCCGGGCIGIASAVYHSQLTVDCADLDPAALALANENIERFGLRERVTALQSDVFSALSASPDASYDIILSNPPYVDKDDLAEMPVEFGHEPDLALGSGADGLDLTRRILRQAHKYLTESGVLVVEVGNSQVALDAAYLNVPFTWLEFEQGGHGVFVLTAAQLKEFDASLRQ